MDGGENLERFEIRKGFGQDFVLIPLIKKIFAAVKGRRSYKAKQCSMA